MNDDYDWVEEYQILEYKLANEPYDLRKLNVGGTIFHTTKYTLKKFGGRLKRILDSKTKTATDENGDIFIDRSPKHFESILNYMRGGNIDLPDSLKELKEIREEARYYELTNLLKLCDELIDEKLAPGTRDHRNLKFIKNDDEYLQIVTEPVKPVFVFHYSPIEHGKFTYPYNLNIQDFLEKYKNQFDIYFKAQKVENNEKVFWKWSIHHYNKYLEGQDGYKYGVKEEIDNDIEKFLKNAPFP
ncbi:hypothetical protein GCK72_007673 [Caenorhabditis remanei]|uniref:BTB domain-containing protein n=1 Tax=Caenorhabditis remanei TaxID=31234 RepID=A0A6A5HM79_CAERE|nr:hypothetical protein GCK72_007673 [Caenorhabditis remanei]KAF1767714.1 hypothetical protein GCK72_007673 [Caenorhabditis remanei]